jgi:O-methyltransferase
MTDDKFLALIVATRYVVDHGIASDVVECRVWRGGSIAAVARILLARGDIVRELHLFVTFEACRRPTTATLRHDGRSAAGLLHAAARDGVYWAAAGLEDARAGMDETKYPRGVRLHPGVVDESSCL